MTNRSKRARERAGLSVGQAAKLLNVPSADLLAIEERDSDFNDADHRKLADLYGVSVEWLTGAVPLRDYAAIEKMILCGVGPDGISFKDRDELAEFAASIPKSSGTAQERLARVRKKNGVRLDKLERRK